jgi:hypothetical protein
MGAINFSLDRKLLEFLARQLPLEVFVETGTFKGDSLRLAHGVLKECHSVEKSPYYFEAARKSFDGVSGVHVYLDDSPAFLRQHDFSSRPVLFWLDAHWCQAGETAGLHSQSPLLGELTALKSLHEKSVVLIDDARLYLCPPPQPHDCAGWPDFHSVVTGLLPLSSRHRLMVLNDVIVFYPAAISAAMMEYAHGHGVDWLVLCQLFDVWQERERVRRLPRFPSVRYFRQEWRRILKSKPDHAAD